MKTQLFVLSFLLLTGCTQGFTVFTKVDKEIPQFNYKLSISNDQVGYTHIATLPASSFNSHLLQATGMDKNGSLVYISYNTQGEDVRGGLDIVEVSAGGITTLKSSLVSENSEYAELKYKDGYVFMAGQKKNSDKNDAVLTVVNVSNPENPTVASELVFETGYYGTSLDIEGNTAYVSVPNIGLKVVDISNPNSISLIRTDLLQSTEQDSVVPYSGGNTPSLPAGFTLSATVDNEWADTWNGRYGHRYQILFKHTFPNNINGTPYYNSWELCFDADFSIATEGTPWNVNVHNLGGGKYKLTPKTQNDANMWSNTNVDIGWNSVLPAPLGTRRIQNIKLTVQGQDCSAGETVHTPAFDNSLFVRRYNGQSLVIGGADKTKVIGYTSSVSLVKDISPLVNEAPSRFLIKGNSLFTNAGLTGLTIIDNLNTAPMTKVNEPLTGTGNGLAIDDCSQLYLAQGEAGLQVADVRNHSAPLSLGSFDYADDFGSANNVFHAVVSGHRHVFVSDGLGGVKVIKVDMPYGCNN